MSLNAYPEYKESGADWLGNIPSHWRVDRLKRSVRSCRNGIWGDEATGDENDLPCVRVADFNRSQLKVRATVPTIRSITEKERLGRVLEKGNLLLEKSGGGETQPVGQVVLYDSNEASVCSNFIAKMVLAEGMEPRYWNYLHSAAYNVRLNVGSINQTSGIQNLDQDRYFNERAPFPPPLEQQAIASFLDRETTKIDALIAEQEKLLTLLAEKRQATISHAVTKGLNKDAPMKDSGVAWLGEVPEHWGVLQLKRAFSSVDYGISESLDAEGEIPILRMGNIVDGAIGLEDLKYVDAVDPYLLLRKGDLLFNRTNSLALVGKVGLYDSEDLTTSFASYLVRIRLFSAHLPKYFSYLLNAPGLLGDVRSRAFEAIGQCNLNPTRYGQLTVAVPPLEEQERIVAYLEQVVVGIDRLRAEAQQALQLLRERRGALITAVVTGKLDVRACRHEA